MLQAIRDTFPILEREVNNKLLVYLDNAATAQKPQSVIDAFSHYYSNYNANIHRGIHCISRRSNSGIRGDTDYRSKIYKCGFF